MKILNYNQFVNEALVKDGDAGGQKVWNTQLMTYICYDINPLNPDSVIVKAGEDKKYKADLEKKFTDILTAVMEKCEKYDKATETKPAKTDDNTAVSKIQSTFNLYENDQDGKLTQELIDNLNKEVENMKGIASISIALVAFGKNDKGEEVPAAYDTEKKTWEESNLKIEDRTMK